MLGFFRYLLLLFGRAVLSLRYRVRIKGLDEVKKLGGPILILPNHPAFADPPIVLCWLNGALRPRPLLFEGNFQGVVMGLMMHLLEAIRVPDTDQISAEGRERALQAIEEVKAALRAGRNVVLWPSGRLQRTGVERLGAARTVSDVLLAVPEAKVVLVRTRGLWGSRFSYGWDGTTPPMGKRFLQGIGWILSNLIFFTPRRQVTLTLEHVERSRLPGLEREKLNPWLEKWYNTDPDQRTFVPVHFLFGERTHEFPPLPTAEEFDLSKVKAETRQAVDEMVLERFGDRVGADELKPDTMLDSFGLDSLTRSELSQAVEKRFGFTADKVPETVGQLYALAAGMTKREPPKPPTPLWFTPPSTEEAAVLAESVPEAAVARALSCRKDVVCADDMAGVLTYERLLVGALVMAKRFRELPGKNVGLLLPSSVACDVALLGLYLADKLPVVLNWTTGPNNLEHAAKLTGLTHVVTSKTFIDRTEVKVRGTEYVYLEGLRKQTGKVELLLTLLKVRWLSGVVRGQTPTPDADSPAVVLFTSGSEKAPKAVPLTHRNLISNQRGGIPTLQVTRRDSILGFLPAFHSFGMSITGLFPILSGVRVVRHPDPTDSFALARKAGLYKPTILVGTPTFVSYILDRAEPGELTSLRLVIVGAEKCPQTVFDRLAKEAPKAQVLEGYGITECSPVVSVNPAGAARRGTVGKPMPGVELSVVDLESEQPVPKGQMGMLLVSGPTVFPGYLGDAPSPFREHGGKRWYVTGDLVELDDDGYIHFSGRLKRFIKAGGEMISLPALEEPFARLYPPTKDGPRAAVEGVETDGGRRVVLFTTEPITLREANEVLHREGFHGVMRLDEVRRVEAIPMLGTGKADYKQLRAQIEQKEEAVGA
jgi:acyl-CoA synthetase (AMP-forming)/AMP-acid ligase II/1-acyl-sn-glycerol-3-phosphate acyltransferase/acyl carrier protein